MLWKVNIFLILLLLNTTVLTSSAKHGLSHRGVNGGIPCAACSIASYILIQLSILYDEPVIKSLERLCNYLPDGYRQDCLTFYDFFRYVLMHSWEDSPDIFCRELGYCFTEPGRKTCYFDGRDQVSSRTKTFKNSNGHKRTPDLKKMIQSKYGMHVCDLPGINSICKRIELFSNLHYPISDVDGDMFSTIQSLRGSYWRGMDCDDYNADTHPGRRPAWSDTYSDSNCNGIYGVEPETNRPYEDMFCKNSQPMGVAVLGDSISAHMHLPEEVFNVTKLSMATFENLPQMIENEFDLPQFSTVTGFQNYSSDEPMNSIYDYLWRRNRCNHRDYQNLGVNGADTATMADHIQESFFRNKTTDHPVILFYALIANDVCNWKYDTLSNMTTPEEMRKNSLRTLKFLEKTLPTGSHVFLVGLVDGSIVYENMKDRIHPIGWLHNDITYARYFDYFNCLEVASCSGWMNSNKTLRDLTTKKAKQLTAVLRDVVQTEADRYQNFKLYFMENPDIQTFEEWEEQGGEVWQLIEPVDGFHPNQVGQSMLARILWKELETKYPDVIGPVNPYNSKIQDIFGDQGMY